MHASLLLAVSLGLVTLPACTEMEGPREAEYCRLPYGCPDTNWVDCMADGSTSPDICNDRTCREWMMANCGTVVPF